MNAGVAGYMHVNECIDMSSPRMLSITDLSVITEVSKL